MSVVISDKLVGDKFGISRGPGGSPLGKIRLGEWSNDPIRWVKLG